MPERVKAFLRWIVAAAVVVGAVIWWRSSITGERIESDRLRAEMVENLQKEESKKLAEEAASKAEREQEASQRREYLDAMRAETVELRRIADELSRLHK